MARTLPVTGAQEVANYFIRRAHDSGSFISNLKLQKLLYYAQAWHLAIFDRRLFPERFQAWAHGPVIPTLYAAYRQYGWKNVDADPPEPKFDDQTRSFLGEFLDEYGPLDAFRLEWLAHHDDPWLKARGNLPAGAQCTNLIDEHLMKRTYRSKLKPTG